MTIKVDIVADSLAPNGVRLTTFLLKYPRFIHSELMTHRVFSRNASSSRAIPFKRQMKMIKEDMAMPLSFLENKPGMQGGKPLSNIKQKLAKLCWRATGQLAILGATVLNKLGVHKQYVNRMVEPWSHITVVLTATDYDNFFALRYHSAAQPEIAELAKKMWERYSTNKPESLPEGQWHLPFVSLVEIFDLAKKVVKEAAKDKSGVSLTDEDLQTKLWLPLIKRSVARCARTSYLNHDGTKPSQEQDEALYDRLLAEQPIHASPAEHQAKALALYPNKYWGNFRGWVQYRKTLPNENITKFEGSLG